MSNLMARNALFGLIGAITGLVILLLGSLSVLAAATQPTSSTIPAAGASMLITTTPTPSPTPTATVSPTPTSQAQIYLPFLQNPPQPLPPPLPPPTPLSGEPPINFADIEISLRAEGLELAYNKIGFHAGDRGRWHGLVDMMTTLDAAGIPFYLKSTDNAEPLYIAQELMRQSGVPHTLVYRRVSGVDNVPNYDASPAGAALYHWEQHKAAFPPELDPQYIWVETINEVDKNRHEWLADFAYATARLTLADGFKWAAFGWSSGEPEPEHWETPSMLRFLRLAGQYPQRLAIALHEYSYTADNIGNIYPYLIGRFQFLFDACDRHTIPRPTTLITEWGWTYDNVPTAAQALEDIAWASWLYAAYPQVKGAAIWYLGDTPGNIEDETAELIQPLTGYSQRHYFAIDPGFGAINTDLFRLDEPVLALQEPLTPYPRPRYLP